MANTILSQFIKNELDAYISDQRAYADPVVVSLIVKAFEAYDEYKRLVSPPKEEIDKWLSKQTGRTASDVFTELAFKLNGQNV